jgi:hypothetical protein
MNMQRMPRLHAVARAQLMLLWQLKYFLGLLLVFAAGVVAVNVFTQQPPHTPPWMMRPAMVPLHVTVAFMGGVAAVLVWVNEGPQSRRYHWSMPVTREVHDVMRILAGAVWLILALAIYCVMTWFTEHPVIREQWLSRAGYFWVGVFITPLLTYLLATTVSLLSGKPMLWLISGVLLAAVLSTELVEEHAPFLADINAALFSDRYPPSLGVALAGGYESAPWHQGKEIYRVYQATAEETFRTHPPLARMRSNMEAELARTQNHLGERQPSEWLFATGVWYVVALLGIAFAVRRRPDV